MSTRTQSPSSTILLILILIITFPVWFIAGSVLIGVVVGLMGAAIGVIAALFGAAVAIVVLPFKLLFGWGHWGWHDGDWSFHIFHHKTLLFIIILVVAALIVRGKKVN